MPSFARELEQTLHNALKEAQRRRHEIQTGFARFVGKHGDDFLSGGIRPLDLMTRAAVKHDEAEALIRAGALRS